MDVLERQEAKPASYPIVPFNLTAAAEALDHNMIWSRIESYISHRWTEREVIWIVEGEGNWQPDLTPASVTAVEKWSNYAWASETLNPSPLGGYELTGTGPYRFTATVGSGTVPADVKEAFRRLAEYVVETTTEKPGSSSEAYDIGSLKVEFQRSASWLGRAMQNSGAADLLRPYRRI